jgi:hypothetical protein
MVSVTMTPPSCDQRLCVSRIVDIHPIVCISYRLLIKPFHYTILHVHFFVYFSMAVSRLQYYYKHRERMLSIKILE